MHVCYAFGHDLICRLKQSRAKMDQNVCSTADSKCCTHTGPQQYRKGKTETRIMTFNVFAFSHFCCITSCSYIHSKDLLWCKIKQIRVLRSCSVHLILLTPEPCVLWDWFGDYRWLLRHLPTCYFTDLLTFQLYGIETDKYHHFISILSKLFSKSDVLMSRFLYHLYHDTSGWGDADFYWRQTAVVQVINTQTERKTAMCTTWWKWNWHLPQTSDTSLKRKAHLIPLAATSGENVPRNTSTNSYKNIFFININSYKNILINFCKVD